MIMMALGGIGLLMYYLARIDEPREEERILKTPRAEFKKDQQVRDANVENDTPYDETVRLLTEIKRSNDKIHFWARACGILAMFIMFSSFIAFIVTNF